MNLHRQVRWLTQTVAQLRVYSRRSRRTALPPPSRGIKHIATYGDAESGLLFFFSPSDAFSDGQTAR